MAEPRIDGIDLGNYFAVKHTDFAKFVESVRAEAYERGRRDASKPKFTDEEFDKLVETATNSINECRNSPPPHERLVREGPRSYIPTEKK